MEFGAAALDTRVFWSTGLRTGYRGDFGSSLIISAASGKQKLNRYMYMYMVGKCCLSVLAFLADFQLANEINFIAQKSTVLAHIFYYNIRYDISNKRARHERT